MDTIEKEQISGNYWLFALDDPRNMCITYFEDDGNAGSATIIQPTVFEVQWNRNFIIAKQRPKNFQEAVTSIFEGEIRDSLNAIGSDLNPSALAYEKYKRNGSTGLNTYMLNKENLILYYLIDTRVPYATPQLFYNETDLTEGLKKRRVGKINNRKYFDYLDRKAE